MFLRIDKLLTPLPEPTERDPNAAAAVQELLGGKFGEMSTLNNYLFQSFNFRGRDDARPFYDLVANIAAEEVGHVELVTHTIGGLLSAASDKGKSGVDPNEAPLEGFKDMRYALHFLDGGFGGRPENSHGLPWDGSNVFNSGNLVLDMLHNFFLESGARNGKLRVYEMCPNPAARALTGYLLVRGGVHQLAYAKAVEKLTGANLMPMFPLPDIRTDRIDECLPHLAKDEHTKLYRFSPDDYREMAAVWNGTHPEDGRPLEVVDAFPAGFPAPSAPEISEAFSPAYEPGEIFEIAAKLARESGHPKPDRPADA